MYALALDCDIKNVWLEIAHGSELWRKPQLVDKVPYRDLILKDDDLGLTISSPGTGALRRGIGMNPP